MSATQPVVAYIGLGNMGAGMATNIAIKGDLAKPLIVFNRSPSRAERLLAQLPAGKAQIARSIDEAVSQADIIFMSLGDDNAVFDTVETILKNDVKDKVILDCSTIAKESSNKVSKQILAAGAEFVACPVMGSPMMASQGKLVALPAGPASAITRVSPLLTGVMTRESIPFPDQEAGVASSLKCIANSMLFDVVQALAEAHVLAQKSGVGSEPLSKFIDLFWTPLTQYSDRMRNKVYYTSEHPPFSVDHARKDIRFALNLAQEHGVQMKALEVADNGYAAVQKHMDGEKADLTALYGAVRAASGLAFED